MNEKEWVGDLRMEGNRIKEMAEHLEVQPGEEVIDAKGCYVFPGFIDAHTHMQMENALAKTADSYETGTAAAVVGGTTTIINFCTGKPDMTLRESYDEELRRAKGHSSCNYRFHMELVKVDEDVLAEIPTMPPLGVTSFKIYMAYGFRISDEEIYKALQAIKKIDCVCQSHCENGDVLDCIMEDLVREGKNVPQSQELAHPVEAEAEAISRLCYIGKMVDHPVHIVHLSTKMGLEEMRKARAQGVKVTAETCTQYLFLDHSVYDQEGTEPAKYVYAPPAHSKEDVKAITEAVIHGEIQTMATDHCSFNYHTQKIVPNNDLRLIPGGIPGVEHRVVLCYTRLLDSGDMSAVDFVKLMAENPAKLYKMYPERGVLKEGSIADIVIYDPEGTRVIRAEDQLQNVDYTPFEGLTYKGRVRDVFLGGERVVENEKLIHRYRGIYAK